MNITSVQKVIKVGSSLAVTIPAKDAKFAGITPGKEVKIDVELVDNEPRLSPEILEEYETFVKQYGKTLKNLSQR